MERAEAKLDYAAERERTARKYLEPGHPGRDARFREAKAATARARVILDRWSAILPQPKEGEHAE